MYLHKWLWGHILEDHLCCHIWSTWVGPFTYVLPGPFMSMHKYSSRTNYDDINGPPDLLCCHKWSPRTIYAQTICDSPHFSYIVLQIHMFDHKIILIGIVFSSNLFSSHTLAWTCVLHLRLQLLLVSFISQPFLNRFQYNLYYCLPYACSYIKHTKL